jgi:hypothetical protein
MATRIGAIKILTHKKNYKTKIMMKKIILFFGIMRRRRKITMSSTVNDWVCTQCNSTNGFHEDFADDEIGYISECKDCKYMEVYREDTETGVVVEDYSGYDHYYNKEEVKS